MRLFEIIRKIYRKLVPKEFRKWINPIVTEFLSHFNGSACRGIIKQSFGSENPNKTFYVIRTGHWAFGLFALTSTIIDHIQYCEKKGYIPIIDTKNYYNSGIQNAEHMYEEDAWNYYYEAINDVKLREIWMSKNVVFSSLLCEPYCRYRLSGYDTLEDDELDYLNKYVKERLKIKNEIQIEANTLYEKLFREKKVLGVAYRSSFKYLEKENNVAKYGHAKQGTIEEYESDINRLLDSGKYEAIFISVDDRDIAEHFKNIYKDRCLYINRPLPIRSLSNEDGRFREFKYDDATGMRTDIEKEGINYLIETMILSRCDGLLASVSGNVKFALIWNGGKYKDKIIYNKGKMAG